MLAIHGRLKICWVRLRRFRFCPHTQTEQWSGWIWGGRLGETSVRMPTSASAFLLFPPDLLPPPLVLSRPPPSMSSFHSPQLVMSPAASDVKVSWAEGTIELRENVRPIARVRACVAVFFLSGCLCVCVRSPFSRVIKDPICHTHTHTALWTPAVELSIAATLKGPCSAILPLHLSRLLSSISPCRVISFLFLSFSSLLLSLYVNTYFLLFLSHLRSVLLQVWWLSKTTEALSRWWNCETLSRVNIEQPAFFILPLFLPLIHPQQVNIPALIGIVLSSSNQQK